MQKLSDSFINLLTSNRFWLIVAGGFLVGLERNNWKMGAISALTAIVAVGSADSIATKRAGR